MWEMGGNQVPESGGKREKCVWRDGCWRLSHSPNKMTPLVLFKKIVFFLFSINEHLHP